MIILRALLFCLVTVISSYASSVTTTTHRITEEEAAAIVRTEGLAKEAALDRREAELLSADMRTSAVAQVGDRKVRFNRVASRPEAVLNREVEAEESRPESLSSERFHSSEIPVKKESVQLTLSGTVWDEAVSELWWNYDGERYRVFVNANFLLFPGLGGFEDAQARYTLLTIITGQNSGGQGAIEKGWRPTLADFSSEGLEYIVVDPKDDAEIDPAAFGGIEAMLRYYAAHHEQMQIRYDNAQKLRRARAAYLEANPPKERDTIINFRPRKNSADSPSTEK